MPVDCTTTETLKIHPRGGPAIVCVLKNPPVSNTVLELKAPTPQNAFVINAPIATNGMAAIGPGIGSETTQTKSLVSGTGSDIGSPVISLMFAGGSEEELSFSTMFQGHNFWKSLQAAGLTLPRVKRGADDSVYLSWLADYPKKRMEMWIHGDPTLRAEWYIDVPGKPLVEDEEHTLADLLEVAKQYSRIDA